MKFNQPLYRYGNVLEGVELCFHKGLVTRAYATKGNNVLQQMLKSTNANKIGEYYLTRTHDFHASPHPMAETLYDENIGGPFGNTHLAIRSAYRDCYRGDQKNITKAQWKKMGFNDSPEHTDIISTRIGQ